MPLSKLTTDQIRDDAEAAVGADDMFHSFTSGYVKGATAWAIWKEKAEGLKVEMERIKKLEWSTDGRKFDGNHKEMVKLIIEIATKALEQFNQNKVK